MRIGFFVCEYPKEIVVGGLRAILRMEIGYFDAGIS